MKKILYISLTGMTEPLGRSQVLEYLIDLSKENKFYLISFERENDMENIAKIKELVEKHDIQWYYFIYSNKYGIFSTVGQIFKVFKMGAKLIKRESIQIIHARSMISATIGMILKKVYGIKLLFDIRGFAIDEKVDSGRIQGKSFLFKSLKLIDNYLYKNSDYIVTLTHKAKDILNNSLAIQNDNITVIPTCASKDVFKKLSEDEKETFKILLGYNKEDKIVIHTGTVSGWYDFESEVRLVKELMRQDKTIHFLILNKNEHDFIRKVTNKYQIPDDKFRMMFASFDEMYKYLNISDISLFFIKSSYSKQASAPTKFAENVACCLPSITNTGVGDMEHYMNQYNVGYLIDINILDKNLSNIVSKILKKMKDEIIDKNIYNELFSKHFDKNMAVVKYQNIYNLLVGKL